MYDFFNGDADGMISLHQYRMFSPAHTLKHTGCKRDINLLRYSTGLKNSKLFVFDLSLKTNQQHVSQAIDNHNSIIWFDHHDPGELIHSDKITCHIDTDPNTCTSWLVDKHLDGMFRPWTIAGAYGDNLHELAEQINPSFVKSQMQTLQTLGETLNYSGYGNTEADLVSHPYETYRDMSKYNNPFEYIDKSELFGKIKTQFDVDRLELDSAEIIMDHVCGQIVLLPETKASVRYSGIYSNNLATDNPDKAFIILSVIEDGYKVSIRAPLNNPTEANTLALRFETGGGREKAAGINYLPSQQLDRLKDEFVSVFG